VVYLFGKKNKLFEILPLRNFPDYNIHFYSLRNTFTSLPYIILQKEFISNDKSESPELFINYADAILYLFLYVSFTMDLLKQNVKHIFHTYFSFYVGIFYPTGKSISPHLLHCSPG
jgi:hypothetical protein